MVSHPAWWRAFLAGTALLGSATALLTGCGQGGPDRPSTQLEGSVTLDEQPIAEGTISFFPQQKGQAQPVKAPITQGHYQADGVPLGKVLVRFTATKQTGKEITIPDSDEKYMETVSIIPPKYKQGISIDVSADKKTHDFALTSK